jgi:putative membrane protein
VSEERFDPKSITRPEPALLTYYLIVALLTLAGFPFVFPVLYFKYHTLKYAFDDEGVSMSWGILIRREICLTYRRIQDIHVTRNLIHRWLGLASVAIQTASGTAGAEMTIEGVRDPESLRDFLYTRMRGARGGGEEGDRAARPQDRHDEALALLRQIRDALRGLASRPPQAGS